MILHVGLIHKHLISELITGITKPVPMGMIVIIAAVRVIVKGEDKRIKVQLRKLLALCKIKAQAKVQ